MSTYTDNTPTTQAQRDTISALHFRGYTLQSKRQTDLGLVLHLKHYLTSAEVLYTIDERGRSVK
jgi:hypothetical protein